MRDSRPVIHNPLILPTHHFSTLKEAVAPYLVYSVSGCSQIDISKTLLSYEVLFSDLTCC